MDVGGTILVTFGTNLKNARQNAGMTQEALAARVNLNKSYVGMLERGQKSPSLEAVAALAHAVGVPVDTLFIDIDDPDSLLPRVVSSVRVLESRSNHALVEKIADLLEQLCQRD